MKARIRGEAESARIEAALRAYPACKARFALMAGELYDGVIFERVFENNADCRMELIKRTLFKTGSTEARRLYARIRRTEILLCALSDTEMLLAELFFLSGYSMPEAKDIYARLMPSELSVSTLKSHKAALVRKLKRVLGDTNVQA